ncbi:hypothetical protein A2U01_0033805, partial [Trifolium medium]|nr:hypothetical protein [Trifolium medium]
PICKRSALGDFNRRNLEAFVVGGLVCCVGDFVAVAACCCGKE